MNKNIILAVIAVAAIGVFVVMRSSKPAPAPVEEPAPETAAEETPAASDAAVMEKEMTYTLADIALHNKETDCWFAVEGQVYDVTEYIAGGKHGGGDAIIEGCGLDATELFNTRPMGSGTPHSDKARGFLSNFRIGTLAE